MLANAEQFCMGMIRSSFHIKPLGERDEWDFPLMRGHSAPASQALNWESVHKIMCAVGCRFIQIANMFLASVDLAFLVFSLQSFVVFLYEFYVTLLYLPFSIGLETIKEKIKNGYPISEKLRSILQTLTYIDDHLITFSWYAVLLESLSLIFLGHVFHGLGLLLPLIYDVVHRKEWIDENTNSWIQFTIKIITFIGLMLAGVNQWILGKMELLFGSWAFFILNEHPIISIVSILLGMITPALIQNYLDQIARQEQIRNIPQPANG